MSVQQQEHAHERPKELSAIIESYDTMNNLLAKNDELQTSADSFQRQLHLANAEIDSLRKQLSQVQRSRDHFFRSHSSVSAQLDGIAELVLAAMRMARNHEYGGRRPSVAPEIAKEVGEVHIPQFLRDGPRPPEELARESRRPVNLSRFAEAIGVRDR